MSEQLLSINIRSPLRRMLTLLPLVLALSGAWFSVSWYVGDTIAEYLNPDDRGIENARLAAAMAPADPITHWTLGEMEQSKLPPDQIAQAISEYERAVMLSPNDYRYWLALGRAFEQADDAGKAEQSMRRAVALAPAYALPRWYLGNLLLRNGNDTQAFTEMRRAGDADPQLRAQLFNVAWQVHGNNPDELDRAIGPAAETRAEFSRYLIDRKELDAALRSWNGLAAAEKKSNRATGEMLIKSMIEARRFRQAFGVWAETVAAEVQPAPVGQLVDGGFERTSQVGAAGAFGWQIKSVQQAQASFDANAAHDGGRSLRLSFKARTRTDINVSQLVVVDPGAQYDLSCFVKTSKLESAGPPEVEILDAADGTLLARSEPAPSGDSVWQPISISFKSGAKSEAVVIRIGRASCGENSDCPIFGTAWYDDFDLKRRG
jgi:tetratricopeptide (TPR) repeat protein